MFVVPPDYVVTLKIDGAVFKIKTLTMQAKQQILAEQYQEAGDLVSDNQKIQHITLKNALVDFSGITTPEGDLTPKFDDNGLIADDIVDFLRGVSPTLMSYTLSLWSGTLPGGGKAPAGVELTYEKAKPAKKKKS